MKWNVDYEITSIIFQLIFLVFFFVKRHLPTRQNRVYLLCVITSFFNVLFDLLTALLNSYAPSRIIPIGVISAANVIYFCLVPCLSIFFFLYILTLTKQYSFVHTPLFPVFCFPAVVSLMLAVSSPWTGFLFYFDDALIYQHGSCYTLEFASNLFYLIVAVAFVTTYRSYVSTIERYSTYFFCSTLAFGALLQGVFFRWVLLTNAMTAMALIVVYLSLQNPDMLIDKTSGLFNTDAFTEMTTELLSDGVAFSCIYFSIIDYQNLDALYGTENVLSAMKDVTLYVKKVFADKRIYRFGNSAFMIQVTNDDDFTSIEQAINNRFLKPFSGATDDIYLAAQIVIIPYWNMPKDISKIQSLLNFANRYAATRGKGATVEVGDDVIELMARERAVERAIEKTVLNNSIQIYFQPIYSTVTGEISSCEALARLFDDELGFIPPDEFIPKAEENGSIVRLGEQIFEKVCQFLAEQEPYQYGLESVHVNLSPIQCKQENLATTLIDITNRYEQSRSLIDLEITETAAVEQNGVIRKNMDKLIAASFSFSLDDYGTGFSNTATIIQLPFSSVKIDKSLLWAYYDKKSRILPDLVNMFHNQKLELIVEGVETKEMVEGLTEMKCQNLQGYYFAKPLPMREFMSYMREFNRSARERKKQLDSIAQS